MYETPSGRKTDTHPTLTTLPTDWIAPGAIKETSGLRLADRELITSSIELEARSQAENKPLNYSPRTPALIGPARCIRRRRREEEMTNRRLCAPVGHGKRATPLKKARGKQFQTPGNEHYNAILRGMK